MAREIERRTALKSFGAAGLVAAASSLLPARSAGAAASSRTDAVLDWRNVARVSKTTATLQVVVNPLIRRGSPIHDNVFRELRTLGADYVRFVPWKPYPRLGVAELDAPSDGQTSWDFSLIDPLVEDFLAATRGHSTIMNFSTIPQWMWRGPWSVDNGQLTVVGGGNGTAKAGFDWTDYTFAADVTPLASASHAGKPYAQAGMVFRMDEGGLNGYAVLISNYPYSSPAASGYVVVVPISGGKAGVSQHKALPFAIDSGSSCRVSIDVSGETFTISVNGTVADTVTDATYAAGTVGFREYGTESARFDNVTVTAPDGSVLLADDFSNGLGKWASPPVVPADPNAKVAYSVGTELAVPVQTVADYYRRLVSWYTRGGFVDEYGRQHRSRYHYRFPYWEVLNELEHGLSPELYTQLYDAIVPAIRSVSPQTKFVGLAQATPGNAAYFEYFLDPANHQPGVPIDMVSYHFYAHVTGDGQDPAAYGPTGFARADSFFSVVDEIEAVRTRLAPHVRTTIDETGTIMDAAATQDDPAPIPDPYWNYSGALYAYMFGNLALKGIDVVGESQLVGYPSQYPSVSMVDWNTGLPNARYRVLQLLLDELRPGTQLVPPPAGASPDSYYLLGLLDHHTRKVLVVNKSVDAASVTIPGLRGGMARVVDEQSAGGPIRTERVYTDTYSLGGYGVAILTLGH